jgi:indolepyruvate ferredoxin oxidoreductase
VASPERTVAVLNVAETPTATMLRHQQSSYPLASGLRARISRSTRGGDMVCIDAQTIAEQLTGDHLAANLVLLGAAFQSGLLPFGSEELAEAVRLNGVDIEASLAAIAWGRTAVASPDAVADAVADALSPANVSSVTPSPVTLSPIGPRTAGDAARSARHEVPPHLEPDPSWPESLRRVARLRVSELIAFQSNRVAARYLEQVRQVAAREGQATGRLSGGVAEAFARGLYALTAVKDEYEVARLHLLDEERASFQRAFPGARAVYMLKPPLLARLGVQRKIKLVRTARPAFHVLRSARHLRATPFDPFGWTAERRAERQFAAEYLSWVAAALEHLTPVSVDAVRAIVDAANDVHGYAHVRQASVAAVRTTATRQLNELIDDAAPQLHHFPLAG